jgi:hypothetical protein
VRVVLTIKALLHGHDGRKPMMTVGRPRIHAYTNTQRDTDTAVPLPHGPWPGMPACLPASEVASWLDGKLGRLCSTPSLSEILVVVPGAR